MATVRTDTFRRVAVASNTFAILLGISIAAPLLRLPQLLAGTIVNATLFAAVVLVGPRAAVSIGILPSLFAILSGQLPAPLAPLVPLIMVGNALLVVVFQVLRERSWWWGVGAAAVVKFAWLYGAASILATGLLPATAVPVALMVLGWPQLVTALAGGVLAYAVLPPARRQ